MQRSLILTAACATLALMAASPASAATTQHPSLRVSYADLDLDNQAGPRVLLSRIRGAAGVMCGDRMGLMSLREHASIRRCMRARTDKAVSDVGNARLTALYYNRHPNITVRDL